MLQVAFFLQVLEACMKNCGRRFHNEVGKFRFLNELIKVVSPKVSPVKFPQVGVRFLGLEVFGGHSKPCMGHLFQYLGDKVSEGVKTKVIEMLYSWTVSLPDEAKVVEAYQMLKSQGETPTAYKLRQDIYNV